MHKQPNQQFYISSHRNQNFPNNHKPPAPPKTFTLAYPRCNHFTAPSLLSPPIHTQPPTQPSRTHAPNICIFRYSPLDRDVRLAPPFFLSALLHEERHSKGHSKGDGSQVIA